MPNERSRPDPDALLAALRREEARARRGRLKVFLGMCPGVGKTYAMLRAAQRERLAGVDLVVGLVETHGRVETEAMLATLPAIPRRAVEYRGTELTELDIEAVRARAPRLVLVDELAHTNAPDSRHAKRWQDVLELLEAGLDVFTTLNIQHVESRADAVRQITGAPVHETVPDSLLDLADELELVDLTPAALLTRLREGKVYQGDRATAAAANFFRESHLTALRELALRFTAERVDSQLRAMRSTSAPRIVWRSGERLLVAVGPSPFSTRLVRWTRRLAAAQGASWLAVHVESSASLPPADQTRLDANLALARELGAELIVTHDQDVAAALVRVALDHNATQIVVGKPRAWPPFAWLHGGTLVDRLLRLGGNIDLYVVPAEEEDLARRRRPTLTLDPALRSPPREYGIVATTVACLTLCVLLLPSGAYLAAGLVYLMAVIGLSLRVGRGPMLLAGVLSAVTWNFLLIPPRFTFQIDRVEDAFLFVTYFVVALVAGQLTARLRAQSRDELRREQRATALFQFTRALAEARSFDEAIKGALGQVDALFDATSALVAAPAAQVGDAPSEVAEPAHGGDRGRPHPASSLTIDSREQGVAEWVSRNRRPAGLGTDTLPAARAYHVPLDRGEQVLGVLAISPRSGRALTLGQRDLLESFARQLALAVESEHLRAAGEREKLLAESERLHRALLDSVSHELRTPLAVITGALESVADPDTTAKTATELLGEARTAAHRLNRLVGNLLDQTRLESGALRPHPDWCDARDLVNAALDAVRDFVGDHPVETVVPDELPPVHADFALTEQALANLLLNALLHTPGATPVFMTAGLADGGRRAFFTVADRGPGFPPAMRGRLFEKFTRGDAARAGGLGLGLSIVRGFTVAQGGEVVVGENPGGGAAVTLYIPQPARSDPPPE